MQTSNTKYRYIKSVDNSKIYYETNISNNKNPCLIFIHGLAGGTTVWKKEIEYFQCENISTIAIDLRGHGKSQRSDNPNFYKFENFVDDVKQVIRNEKLESYCLIGHCLGGMVSLKIAADNLKGLKHLVLIDSIYETPGILNKFDNVPLFKLLLKIFANSVPDLKLSGLEDHESFKGTGSINLQRGISDILHVGLKGYLLICEELLGISLEKLLSKINMSVLIIEGKEDSLVIPEVAKALNNRIKTSELDMIDDANHFLIVNNPLKVSREIERFLIKQKFI